MGTASRGKLKAWFVLGRQDYYLGGHPVWQLCRGCFQMGNKPYVFGGVFLLAGYGWAWITGVERAVSPELMRFHRREQMQRLRHDLLKAIRIANVSEASS
jgi:hypothetical protein